MPGPSWLTVHSQVTLSGALAAEQRHDMPPRRDERRWRDVPVTPRVPGGVHLMPEADDDRMAEVPDAVGIGAQVDVVVAGWRSAETDAWVGSICTKGMAPCAWTRSANDAREGLRPAAVIADHVRLLSRRLGEVRDRP